MKNIKILWAAIAITLMALLIIGCPKTNNQQNDSHSDYEFESEEDMLDEDSIIDSLEYEEPDTLEYEKYEEEGIEDDGF